MPIVKVWMVYRQVGQTRNTMGIILCHQISWGSFLFTSECKFSLNNYSWGQFWTSAGPLNYFLFAWPWFCLHCHPSHMTGIIWVAATLCPCSPALRFLLWNRFSMIHDCIYMPWCMLNFMVFIIMSIIGKMLWLISAINHPLTRIRSACPQESCFVIHLHESFQIRVCSCRSNTNGVARLCKHDA